MVHKNTQAASKHLYGERSWMLVPKSKLLRFDDILLATYCLPTKVAEVMRCFKSVIPSHPVELVQTSSVHIQVEEILHEGKIETSALIVIKDVVLVPDKPLVKFFSFVSIQFRQSFL